MTEYAAEHAVVIAGAGSTGLMLAGELALAGVEAVIVERRPDQELVGWRALGFSARTIEVLDQRGIAQRFIEIAQVGQHSGFGGIHPLDLSDFPTRHGYGLGLPQRHIERLLAEWAGELKVPFLRSTEVVGFTQDDSGVDVALSDGRTLRAQYLVGCDGGRSLIRKTAGNEFEGWDATMGGLIAEPEFDEEPEWGIRRTPDGVYGFSRPDADGPIRAQAADLNVGRDGEPTLEDLRASLIAAYGTDFGLRSAAWISRFTDTTRQAASYRAGRVLLAGDAAHVHGPHGGQGLSLGVQDAVNLGWKLAQVVKGVSPETLLDTYQAERHPVAARVLQNTMAQVALTRNDERTEALRAIVADLLTMDAPRKRIAGMMSMLDVHYALGDGHPLLGRRMPDLDLATAAGPLRVYTLLHEARPVLLNLGAPGALDDLAGGRAERLRVVDAEVTGGPGVRHAGAAATWELPVLGDVPAPAAVLIRPDGYVAWVGSGTGDTPAGSAGSAGPAGPARPAAPSGPAGPARLAAPAGPPRPAAPSDLAGPADPPRPAGPSGPADGLAEALTTWFGLA